MAVSMRTQGTANPVARASPWALEKIRHDGSGLVHRTNIAPLGKVPEKMGRAAHKAIARKTMGSKSVRKKLLGGSSATFQQPGLRVLKKKSAISALQGPEREEIVAEAEGNPGQIERAIELHSQ